MLVLALQRDDDNGDSAEVRVRKAISNLQGAECSVPGNWEGIQYRCTVCMFNIDLCIPEVKAQMRAQRIWVSGVGKYGHRTIWPPCRERWFPRYLRVGATERESYEKHSPRAIAILFRARLMLMGKQTRLLYWCHKCSMYCTYTLRRIPGQ